MGGTGGPGRLSMTGMSVRRLMAQAYEIHDSQIVGGPDWLGSQGYDINATMAGTPPPDVRRMMTKTLLRDRFKLTFHTEKRDLPIYALVVQRSDGRLGPGLKRITDDECPPPGSPRRGGPPAGPPPPAASPFDPNAVAACGSIIFGPGRLLAHGVPVDMLSRSLANLPAITAFNRPVTNLTKLEGFYDFDFRWNNDFGPRGPTAARLTCRSTKRDHARGRAGAVHGSAGAIGVEAEPAAGDTGCPCDRFDRAADRELSRGTKRPLRVSNRTGRPTPAPAFSANQPSVRDVKTTRYPEQR